MLGTGLDSGLCIQTEIGPAAVSGDPRLVERLVRNLVANTGPAIPALDIDRLFQPFRRLASNRSDQQDGTGLGLSIVKTIADAHDATITATPQQHGGLRVEVSFPSPVPDRRVAREDSG